MHERYDERIPAPTIPVERGSNAMEPSHGSARPAAESMRAVTPWHVVLLLATVVTTTWAGALHQGIDLVADPSRWTAGVPYALALMGILGVHELGHYIVARRRGVDVTLPYFIPAPFFLGTFGAFIRMRSIARDRPATFDIAVAGPLAGLVAAMLALVVGLRAEATVVHGGTSPASSFLLAAIYRSVTGRPPLETVQLGALAFSGWIGLVVTALNLVPVGQLDGGHIAYALLGRRQAALVGQGVLLLMVAAGLLFGGHWLTWAIVVWAIAGVGHPPSLDEERALGPGRTLLAVGSLVLLLAIVLPWPA